MKPEPLPPAVEQELLDYLADVGELPRDEWDVDTAAETPAAIEAPGPKKRSGEYKTVDLNEEITKLKRECYK